MSESWSVDFYLFSGAGVETVNGTKNLLCEADKSGNKKLKLNNEKDTPATLKSFIFFH